MKRNSEYFLDVTINYIILTSSPQVLQNYKSVASQGKWETDGEPKSTADGRCVRLLNQIFTFFHLCICICVFVFAYLYLSICICVFVFAYFYLCIYSADG